MQTPSEAPPPAPIAHAQTTPSPSVHTHSHPPTRMFGDTVTAHHVTKVKTVLITPPNTHIYLTPA